MCTPGNFSSCSRMPIIRDRKSTRLNSSHTVISYAVFCLKKKKKHQHKKHIVRDYAIYLKQNKQNHKKQTVFQFEMQEANHIDLDPPEYIRPYCNKQDYQC